MRLRSRSFAAFAMMGLLFGMAPVAPVRAEVTVTIDGETLTTVSPGDLIRGTSFSAVYYMGEDGFRYVFPNEKTYGTWYGNFDLVKTLSDADLATFQMGGNVTYKPGSRLIKINSDPKTYAVDSDGSLRWVTSEDVAVGMLGADWNMMIDDVPDGFFGNYTVGLPLETADEAQEFQMNFLAHTTPTISTDKGLSPYSMLIISDMTFRDVTSGAGIVTTIQAGQTVMFFNNDSVNHTATAEDDSWGTGTMKPLQYFVRRFDAPGTYTYYCSYHPEMTGTIVVTEAEAL